MNRIIVDFAIIASGVVGYFISISLISTYFFRNRANNYLSLSLFLLTSLALLGWFDLEDTVLEFLDNPVLEYLLGVTLFTYFLIQIQHKYLQRKWYKWLYVPFVGAVVIETILYINTIYNFFDLGINDLMYFIMDNASFIFNVVLIVWGRKLIKGSTISREKKRWLLRLNFFIISLIICWLLSSIEFYVFDSDYVSPFLWIMLSFFSWWILYYGVFRLQIVVQKEEIHRYLLSKKTTTAPVKKKVSAATVSKVISQLYTLMEEEELYKNPLLSRLDLATRLGTSEGYLSQIINQELNKSSIQFVNEYRIEAAKSLLQDPMFHKYSVEAIGMEVGFKSNSAFYKTFNTSEGMSPGAYRKLQKTS
ncbi:helix-turn-helix domain-containing protein [Aquimarina sp. D1M17]|uniref:helix-turn-helix domain-containing protein n=1 Tax=Aquimarina acroporae TaxID=2937283 RepID=UPI0020BE8151|nr:helix-turn-helix domain-containing protein [Aquimarina acroporae]MCK8521238.1 helix-turn-helix domain-containing protein [Aquimarina acroporae]